MKVLLQSILIISMVFSTAACESLKVQPYSPAPDGVSIVGNQSIGYRTDSIKIKRRGINASAEALQFCFAQNIPGIIGSPTLNLSKTRIVAQGRDQVSFSVPMTGTSLNFDIMFSVTAFNDTDSLNFDFTNLRIKGTWSANEGPLPGSKEAYLYVEGAFNKINKITDNVIGCLQSEG